MSKKIISKIKQPQQKCPYRSSSVGNDSCLRDDPPVDYSLLCRCTHHLGKTLPDHHHPIDKQQLPRLEFINEQFPKPSQANGDNHHSSEESHRSKHGKPINRHNLYLQPPGPLSDLDHLQLNNCCDLVDSAYRENPRKSIPKFKSSCFRQLEYANNGGECHRKSEINHSTACHNPTICDTDESNNFKCRDTKTCTAMTYFPPRKVSFPNDRLSNSSDTSRQSSTSQHIKLGIDLFNRNPNCGVEYLRSNGIAITDKELAELFIKKKGFNKRRLFEFLTNIKNYAIHESFCNLLDLKNKSITEVLREYLKISYITGEYNVMIKIVEALSAAYMKQHSEGGIMGLNSEQINTIFQFLITFNINEKMNKSDKKISREYFIELLQNSLTTVTTRNAINRQLASCLYLDIFESPLSQPIDEKSQNLEMISKLFVEIPKGFTLMELHRYIVCHVDLYKVVLPDSTRTEKISYHDRTVFLFNDYVIITKKKWVYDSNSSYRVKQIISLSDIKCAFVKRGASQIVQIINAISNEPIVSFYSKLIDDSANFYATLEQTINFHRTVVEYQNSFDVKLLRWSFDSVFFY